MVKIQKLLQVFRDSIKKQAVLKELSIDLCKGVSCMVQIKEREPNDSTVMKVMMCTMGSVILKSGTLGITNARRRTSSRAQLSKPQRRALVKDMIKNTKLTLTELQRSCVEVRVCQKDNHLCSTSLIVSLWSSSHVTTNFSTKKKSPLWGHSGLEKQDLRSEDFKAIQKRHQDKSGNVLE